MAVRRGSMCAPLRSIALMECRPEAPFAHRASGATLRIRPLTSVSESLTPCEGRSVRQLRAPEDREERARQHLLDVPQAQDRRPLSEVPAPAGRALPGLRAARAQRVPLTIVWPSSATRTVGARSEIVPANSPLGAGPPPWATAFALPFSPAAT